MGNSTGAPRVSRSNSFAHACVSRNQASFSPSDGQRVERSERVQGLKGVPTAPSSLAHETKNTVTTRAHFLTYRAINTTEYSATVKHHGALPVLIPRPPSARPSHQP